MKDPIEYLSFEEEDYKPKVGRPKLADKQTKKKSLIVAFVSFVMVGILIVFGYGTLFGFKSINLKGTALSGASESNVLIEEIKPIIKNITIKENTMRKLYVNISPSTASNKEIKYTSSDESVVMVSKNGEITGMSVGNATVKASTLDGSNKEASFNISVVKNADGKCEITSLNRSSSKINYSLDCTNAVVKSVNYSIDGGAYTKLLTKKQVDSIPISKEDENKKFTLKVVYYANNSSVTKYDTKSLNNSSKKTTTKPTGKCLLEIKKVNKNSAMYDVSCMNATVTDIAYKIGNGSYIGLDTSSLADTVIFEESEVTRAIYFKINYKIDGTNDIMSVTKNSIIERN